MLDARLEARAASSPPPHVIPDRGGGWNIQREGIVVAEDHAVIRQGVRLLISGEEGLQVVAEDESPRR